MIALENIALRQGSFELSDLSLELAAGEYGNVDRIRLHRWHGG